MNVCRNLDYYFVIIQTLSILGTIYLRLNRHHSNLEYFANNLLTFEWSSFKPWVFCQQFTYLWIVIIQTLSILPTIYLPLNSHHSNLEYFANNLLTFESSSFKLIVYCQIEKIGFPCSLVHYVPLFIGLCQTLLFPSTDTF